MEWVDIVKRDQAWSLAKTALINESITITGTLLLNCLKWGEPTDLNEDPATGIFKELLDHYGTQ